ncbi:MAG: DUF1592 domain-containing protein [Pirellulaceae bacterium]
MPDDELLVLAEAGKLHSQLATQVERMLADSKSERFVENFVGYAADSRSRHGRDRRSAGAGPRSKLRSRRAIPSR